MSDPLFVLNRIVDCGFFADLIFNMNLMYFDVESGFWERRRHVIARRFMAGPGILDCISTVPYDLVAYFNPYHFTNLATLRGLRIARAAKLARTLEAARRGARREQSAAPDAEVGGGLRAQVRLVRTSRLLRRMEDNMGVNYGHITLVKFFVATVLLMHWMACMMTLARTRRPRAAPRRAACARVREPRRAPSRGQVHTANDNDCTWVNFYLTTQRPNEHNRGLPCTHMEVSEFTLYISGLYWCAHPSLGSRSASPQGRAAGPQPPALCRAAMTISTVGYGDVTPQNNSERVFVIIGLFVGALPEACTHGSGRLPLQRASRGSGAHSRSSVSPAAACAAGASFFSYVVGTVCGVIAKLEEHVTEQQARPTGRGLAERGRCSWMIPFPSVGRAAAADLRARLRRTFSAS